MISAFIRIPLVMSGSSPASFMTLVSDSTIQLLFMELERGYLCCGSTGTSINSPLGRITANSGGRGVP